MGILLLFIFIELFGIPLLLLAITSKLKPNGRDASPFQSLLPVLLAVGISLLFLLPITLFSLFYTTFLMCAVGVLLVVYFFVWVHGNDIKANLKVYGSILVLGTAGILAAIFVALMPGDEEQQYNYATAHQLARALGMHPVEKNVVFKDAVLIIKGDTVIGKSNYFALPPPVFMPRGKLFYYLLSQPGVFHIIKPRGELIKESVAESLFLPTYFQNKLLILKGDGKLATMNIDGQLGKNSVQLGSYTSGGYLIYQDKVILSDAEGVYVVSLRTSDILWQRKYKEYEASFNQTLDGNLLVVNINKDIQQKDSSFTEQQCLAINLDDMSIAWQHRPVYLKSDSTGHRQAWSYWAGNHALALPAGLRGYNIIATQTGSILCHFNQGQPKIQHLTTNRLYSIDSTQTLTAWNLQTQTRLWQRPADATVLVHQNNIVCKHNDTLSVVDMRTGMVKKRLVLKDPLPQTLAIINDVLHVDDTLYR
jgi:hypothetical protein